MKDEFEESDIIQLIQTKLDGLHLQYINTVIEVAKSKNKLNELKQVIKIFYEAELKQTP